MVKENQNFIIEQDSGVEYIDLLIDLLEAEMQRILDFFGIAKLKEKKIIKIWSSREEYQTHLEKYVSKYYDWMIADTHDGNINLLSLEECRKTKHHEDITMTFFLQTIVHEFVHICQQQINPNATNVEWFWEALATNLGNPCDCLVPILYDKNDLMFRFASLTANYNTAYTIGKFMLETYPHSQIMEYVQNPKKLIDDTDDIIAGTRRWLIETHQIESLEAEEKSNVYK